MCINFVAAPLEGASATDSKYFITIDGSFDLLSALVKHLLQRLCCFLALGGFLEVYWLLSSRNTYRTFAPEKPLLSEL